MVGFSAWGSGKLRSPNCIEVEGKAEIINGELVLMSDSRPPARSCGVRDCGQLA
jgi:hypothetical protein